MVLSEVENREGLILRAALQVFGGVRGKGVGGSWFEVLVAACGFAAARRMLAGADAAVNDNAAVAVVTGVMLRQSRVRSDGSSRNGRGGMMHGWIDGWTCA